LLHLFLKLRASPQRGSEALDIGVKAQREPVAAATPGVFTVTQLQLPSSPG